MKVLFHHHTPFALEHGPFQTQIIQTRAALEQLGVEVEFLRWEDGQQRGDVLHFFGRFPGEPLRLAQQKRMKVVMTESLAEQSNWPPWQRWLWRTISRVAEKAAPSLCADVFAWESYRRADACVAMTTKEGALMHELFGAPKDRVHVIPNGAEEKSLQGQPPSASWLETARQLKQLYEALLKTSR